MAQIDQVAEKPWFLASFFGAPQTGLFEVVMVSLGGLAIAAFLVAALVMPLGMEVASGP
jgi:hypothetical protein